MRSHSWARTMVVAATCAMSVVLSAGTPAAAHDALVSVTPGDGATVSVAPGEVLLEFSDAVEPIGTAVVVHGSDGTTVSSGPPTISGRTVRQALVPLGADGAYQVSFRVVSADGHPVTGSTTFALRGVGPSMTPAPGGAAGGDGPAGLSPLRATGSDHGSVAAALGAGAVLLFVVGAMLGISRRRRAPHG